MDTCAAIDEDPAPEPPVKPRPIKPANCLTVTVGDMQYDMVRVDGGTFQMGGDAVDSEADEKPAHNVTLSTFYIGLTEVTQAQWKAVMGSNPSEQKGDDLPVENVTWEDCQTFINRLNNLSNNRFRLPSEAEWEFAARGGKKSKGYTYSGSNDIGTVAWYGDNSEGTTHSVGSKEPNELGIYDMSGNVWEWCQDRYGKYRSEAQVNPIDPTSGPCRVNRGGCWGSQDRSCRPSFRGSDYPNDNYNYLGLRLILLRCAA
ncbi:MAG: SUMF1/EgtB/PvdO family nonheme iron enzyme, partial [Bacteroidaceae bacterium]|nr:SUMF1/EgtB/PvdO family nonheme iron enzyme [Bacteroidaceae bacterium]